VRRCSWGRRYATVERMTIQRMEHVGIVVDDLVAATEFFVEVGLKLQGEGLVEGGWVDRVVRLEGIRVEYAMMEAPDGHGRLELVKSHAPAGGGGDRHAPAKTPGLRHLAFAVDDIDAVVASLRARGAELVGEVENYEGIFGSATSAARRESSSSWPSGSAEGSGNPSRLSRTAQSRQRTVGCLSVQGPGGRPSRPRPRHAGSAGDAAGCVALASAHSRA
jgi:catechol 2,3-dioxygenase-like lactoylglutathione lyase family enzyme